MFSPLTHDDPRQLGAYRLIARLGSGGMGTVYLARSLTGRTAALKTMHAHIAGDPAFRTRFRLEVDAARVIGGVHGARVFDADPSAATPWMATEYLLGPPLDEAVASFGPLPEPAVRALGAGLCRALARLHASEVVHRDLKPSNIMVTAEGPKVIDLGIARAIGDDRLTRTGAAAGTPAFMSPEQATGEEHTPAGDVFALASVLVHAATGHGPFGTGQPADILYRVRYAEPDLTGVPEALLPALTRCLAKDPAQRPSTMELAAQLAPGPGDFAEHLPEPLLMEIARRSAAVWHVRPTRLPPPAYETVVAPAPTGRTTGLSRRRLLALGGGSVAGLAATGVGAWAWLGNGKPEGSGGGSAAPKPAGTAQTGPRWESLWQVKAEGSPDRLPPAAILLKDLVIAPSQGYTLQGLDPRTGEVRWADGDPVFPHRVAADGEHVHALDYALEEEPLRVATLDPATGKLTNPLAEPTDLSGFPLGTQLLCAGQGAVYMAASRGPQSVREFRKDQAWFLAALDSRTGRKLWANPLPARSNATERLHFLAAEVRGGFLVLVQQLEQGDLNLVVRDAGTGKARWSTPLDGPGAPFARAVLTVDDQHVYPAAGGLRALDLRSGAVVWHHAGGTPQARFGPPTVKNGVVYAVEGGRGLVAVSAADGKALWAQKGRQTAETELAYAPVVGRDAVYSPSPSGLLAADLRTGAAKGTFKAAPARYYAHESAQRLIAVGPSSVAGYPLR
ncbi:PQQ-binding-like beta-propeller repeat protein [Streptomyces sp. NPDC093546]|uniref:serine/threonine-protein kinase n=1 Tax=Streptomyces sp. NPDC093546 TaxID=3366040 RepID=UPI00380ACE41